MTQKVYRTIENLRNGTTVTFEHCGSAFKYGVTKLSCDDSCLVFWSENGKFGSTVYPTKLVIKFFTEGTWIEI